MAGVLVSGFQVFIHKPANFGLLEHERLSVALASVFFLLFAAPFMIMRNIVTARRSEGPHVQFVAIATVFAALWSLMNGTCMIMALQAIGFLA